MKGGKGRAYPRANMYFLHPVGYCGGVSAIGSSISRVASGMGVESFSMVAVADGPPKIAGGAGADATDAIFVH